MTPNYSGICQECHEGATPGTNTTYAFVDGVSANTRRARHNGVGLLRLSQARHRVQALGLQRLPRRRLRRRRLDQQQLLAGGRRRVPEARRRAPGAHHAVDGEARLHGRDDHGPAAEDDVRLLPHLHDGAGRGRARRQRRAGDADRVPVQPDLVGADGELPVDGATRTAPTRTALGGVDGVCSNVDCHNSKPTATTPTAYDWYDAAATACVMCHTAGGATNDPISGLHDNSPLPTVSQVAHDDAFGVAGVCIDLPHGDPGDGACEHAHQRRVHRRRHGGRGPDEHGSCGVHGVHPGLDGEQRDGHLRRDRRAADRREHRLPRPWATAGPGSASGTA